VLVKEAEANGKAGGQWPIHYQSVAVRARKETMMRTKFNRLGLVIVAVGALQVLLVVSCTRTPPAADNKTEPKAADTKSTASPAEANAAATTSDGVQLTVLSITRAKEREVLPGFPTGQKMVAKKGTDFALLQLKVKSVAAGKQLDIKRLQLQDAKGNTFKCVYEATDLCETKGGDAATCELPFSVTEGVALSKLKFGDAVIDLSKVRQ
jgi:hypothetical protein